MGRMQEFEHSLLEVLHSYVTQRRERVSVLQQLVVKMKLFFSYNLIYLTLIYSGTWYRFCFVYLFKLRESYRSLQNKCPVPFFCRVNFPGAHRAIILRNSSSQSEISHLDRSLLSRPATP